MSHRNKPGIAAGRMTPQWDGLYYDNVTFNSCPAGILIGCTMASPRGYLYSDTKKAGGT
ncbi:MAG: hypothetical protein ABFD96_21635 [Armatimonadia bacterium]